MTPPEFRDCSRSVDSSESDGASGALEGGLDRGRRFLGLPCGRTAVRHPLRPSGLASDESHPLDEPRTARDAYEPCGSFSESTPRPSIGKRIDESDTAASR